MLDQTVGRLGVPAGGAGAHVVPAGLRLPAHREGAGRLGRRGARPGGLRPRRCGATGRSTSTRPPAATRATATRSTGKRRDHRRLLRHRPGRRAQGRAGRRHPGPGRARQGQARGRPGPTIERRGGTAHVYGCDLSDLEAIDALCEQLAAELPPIDFVVNNAGRSIRRSLRLSHDRFHDFERTMQLNYFGAIRLVMGLLPRMRKQKRGHIVNI